MSRSTRLEPFARLADQRQQGAARSLQASREELVHYEARLGELKAYRAEYVERLQKIGKSGSSANNIKRFLAFISQVDEGVRQLESLIALTRGRFDQRREEWLAARSRFRVLDEVLTRARSEEDRNRLRSEQRESDERAAQVPRAR